MARTTTIRPLARQAALLLACILLWLGTGAALSHTDDLSGLRTFAAGHARVHTINALPPAAPCAACEWAQIAPTVPTSAVPVFAPAFVRAVFCAALMPSPGLRPHGLALPRAPPVYS